MKNNEKEYLYSKKTRDGLTPDMANYEIARDEYYINKTKQDYKDLLKTIKQLEKENKELKKKINKQIISPRESIVDDKIVEIKKSNCDDVSIKELNRILNLIEMEKSIGLSDLTKTCALKPKKCKSALNFLIRNKLIKEVKGKNKVILTKV